MFTGIGPCRNACAECVRGEAIGIQVLDDSASSSTCFARCLTASVAASYILYPGRNYFNEEATPSEASFSLPDNS